MQALKNFLVRQGPDSALVRAALHLQARSRGFRLAFGGGAIRIQNGQREVVLNARDYIEVPFTMANFNAYFDAFVPVVRGERERLDFSLPARHTYRRHNVAFEFPCIPEEDMLETFTYWYVPQPGDVVWDVGAHAGATTYFFSQMVGTEGMVYAFEPDEVNCGYLMRNLEAHQVSNVRVIKKALAGHTGQVSFHMDGTMAAGIPDYLTYTGRGRVVPVPALAFADACAELDNVPSYVKMDIEGAEIAVIESAIPFLKEHAVHFAIESDHRVGGRYTFHDLDRLFPAAGYEVCSSGKFGQMFTWARKAEATPTR
ncbi:MAG: FkbM family methyltransferase [Terriglobales bacterium]